MMGSVMGILTGKLGVGKGGICPQSRSRFVLEMANVVPSSSLLLVPGDDPLIVLYTWVQLGLDQAFCLFQMAQKRQVCGMCQALCAECQRRERPLDNHD